MVSDEISKALRPLAFMGGNPPFSHQRWSFFLKNFQIPPEKMTFEAIHIINHTPKIANKNLSRCLMSRVFGSQGSRGPGDGGPWPKNLDLPSWRGHITFTESTDVARVSWNFWKGARWIYTMSALGNVFPKHIRYGCFFTKIRGWLTPWVFLRQPAIGRKHMFN